MIPWALRDLFGEFFPVGNGADKLFADFSSVLEFAPVDHIEAGDADEATFVRELDIALGSPSGVSGDIGFGLKLFDNKIEDRLSVIDGVP